VLTETSGVALELVRYGLCGYKQSEVFFGSFSLRNVLDGSWCL